MVVLRSQRQLCQPERHGDRQHRPGQRQRQRDGDRGPGLQRQAQTTAAGTATDVFGAALPGSDFTLTGTVHTNAGTYVGDAWSFSDPSSNYLPASGTVTDSIGQANANASVTAIAGLIYNGSPQTTAAGRATNVLGHALPSSDFDLTGTVHTNAGTYAGDAWSFSDPSGNYLPASGTVTVSIAPCTLTWIGGDGTTPTAWSDANNWSPGFAPGADGSGSDTLIFNSSDAHTFTSQNDILGLSLASIEITDDDSTPGDDFTISGNAVTLTGPGGITNNMVGTATTVSLAHITLGDSDTWTNSQGTLNLASPIDLAGNTLTVDGAGATNIGDVISGSVAGTDAMVKTGSGTLTLSNTNTYTGTTTINGGTLVVAANGAMGLATDSGIMVASSATLAFAGGVNYTTAEPLTISGTGLGGAGAIESIGSNSFAGSVALAANATINSATSGSTFTLNGNAANNNISIAGGDYALTFAGVGNTLVNGVISGQALVVNGSGIVTLANPANAYSGPTTINAGTLQIASDGSLGSAFNGNYGAVNINAGTLEALETIGNTTLSPITSSRTYTLESSASAIEVDGSQTLTITQSIGGAGALNKTGLGTLVLPANDTYGDTIAEQGTLQTSATSSLGTGAVTMSGGTLELKASATLSSPQTYYNDVIALVNSTIDVENGPAVMGAGHHIHYPQRHHQQRHAAGSDPGDRFPAGRPHLRARYQRRHADPRRPLRRRRSPHHHRQRVGRRGPRRQGLQPGQRDHLQRLRRQHAGREQRLGPGHEGHHHRGHGHGRRRLRSERQLRRLDPTRSRRRPEHRPRHPLRHHQRRAAVRRNLGRRLRRATGQRGEQPALRHRHGEPQQRHVEPLGPERLRARVRGSDLQDHQGQRRHHRRLRQRGDALHAQRHVHRQHANRGRRLRAAHGSPVDPNADHGKRNDLERFGDLRQHGQLHGRRHRTAHEQRAHRQRRLLGRHHGSEPLPTAVSSSSSSGTTTTWTLTLPYAFKVTAPLGDTITAAYTATGNFASDTATVTQTVTKRAITLTAAAWDKIYDGSTAAPGAVPTVTGGSLAVNPVTGENDTLDYTESFTSRNAISTGFISNPLVINQATGSVSDGDGGNSSANYSVTYLNSTAGAILPLAITVTATAATKPFDGNTSVGSSATPANATPTITACTVFTPANPDGAYLAPNAAPNGAYDTLAFTETYASAAAGSARRWSRPVRSTTATAASTTA